MSGKTKSPRHRPSKDATADQHLFIASYVQQLQNAGCKKLDAAVRETADKFKISERTVWSCLKESREAFRREEMHYETMERHERAEFTDEEMAEAADWWAEYGDEYGDDRRDDYED